MQQKLEGSVLGAISSIGIALILQGCVTSAETGSTTSTVNARSTTSTKSNIGKVFSDYRGTPEIVPGTVRSAPTVAGVVFEDLNRNGTKDGRDRGIEGVKVSNGRDVVLTDSDGR
ncbi:MAG: hypothetical protein AAF668_15590, partial [Pseudomonadota bacterium]